MKNVINKEQKREEKDVDKSKRKALLTSAGFIYNFLKINLYSLVQFSSTYYSHINIFNARVSTLDLCFNLFFHRY